MLRKGRRSIATGANARYDWHSGSGQVGRCHAETPKISDPDIYVPGKRRLKRRPNAARIRDFPLLEKLSAGALSGPTAPNKRQRVAPAASHDAVSERPELVPRIRAPAAINEPFAPVPWDRSTHILCRLAEARRRCHVISTVLNRGSQRRLISRARRSQSGLLLNRRSGR